MQKRRAVIILRHGFCNILQRRCTRCESVRWACADRLTHYCVSALHLGRVHIRRTRAGRRSRSYAPSIEETREPPYVLIPWWECVLEYGLVPHFRDVAVHLLGESRHEPGYGRRCRGIRSHCRGREQVCAGKFNWALDVLLASRTAVGC